MRWANENESRQIPMGLSAAWFILNMHYEGDHPGEDDDDRQDSKYDLL